MLVDDFLTVAGNHLQEDYTTSPVWSKAEVFGYLQQAVRTFCQLTQLVDKCEIRLVHSTTGEADVPGDFEALYRAQWEQGFVDSVTMDELDFVSGSWISGTTGSPGAVTVIGSGDNAVVRYVPVPTSVWDGDSSTSPTAGLVLNDGADDWTLTCDGSGVVVTTKTGSGATTPVLASPHNNWNITVDTDGVLSTTPGTPPAVDVSLAGVGSVEWLLTCTDYGELFTKPVYTHIGLAVAALLDYGTYLDFNSGLVAASVEYGVVVDAYCGSVSTTPSNIIRANYARGLSLYAHTSTETGMLWYKGKLRDLDNYHSQLWLNDAFVPVVLHGVLALAFGHDGDGRDPEKAKLMRTVFRAECQTIKEIFQSRWA